MKKSKIEIVSKEEELTNLDEQIIKNIGLKLKELRKAAGFKNYENFAFENDLNRVQYGRMETGINFTIKSLLKILAVHKMSLEEFFKGL